MPKGTPLTKEQREKIYDLHTMGVRHDDIAQQFGINVGTVSKCVSTQRKLVSGKRVDKMAEVVVAGDKKNGRLVSTKTNQYEGTCLIKGKMKRRTFTAINAKRAQEQWERWCEQLHDEEAFMDMVARNVDTTPAPVPDIEVKRREPEPEPEVEPVVEPEPVAEPEPIVAPKFEPTPRPVEEQNPVDDHYRTVNLKRPVYLLMATVPESKAYGLYTTMELAIDELDKLNDVASFLGKDDAFTILEVPWRG